MLLLWHTCAGKFVDAESDPDEVVTELEGLLQHISGLGEALGVYNQYLTLFDATPDDLNTLAMAEKEANSRYQVRVCAESWAAASWVVSCRYCQCFCQSSGFGMQMPGDRLTIVSFACCAVCLRVVHVSVTTAVAQCARLSRAEPHVDGGGNPRR